MDEQLQQKMQNWLYRLTKQAASWSYAEFLVDLDISEDEYEKIKEALNEKLGIKPYV
jgi:hypothetical protein